MKVTERRKAILTLLETEKEALSGNELAERFGVSRQIIVQDIAFLKKAGYTVRATHCGYMLQAASLVERVFKVWHTSQQTEDELNCIVELGGTISDVFVWHKVYGKITASLNISTKEQINLFLEGVRTGKSTELMNITGGYHYHTVLAQSEEILDRIATALNERDYIVPEIHTS